jgi:hypothetical protein
LSSVLARQGEMLTYAVAFPPVFAVTGKIYDDEGGISGRERTLRVGLCVFIRQSILAVIIKEHQLGRTCYQPAAEAARTEGKRLLRRRSLSRAICTRERNLQMLAWWTGQGVAGIKVRFPQRAPHAYSFKMRSFKEPLCFN